MLVNPAQYMLVGLVQLYRWTLSPAKTFLFGPTSGCRFTPSCAEYAQAAVRRHGAARGSWLAARRICRCHPWGGCGHDPVPEFVSGRIRPSVRAAQLMVGPQQARSDTPCRTVASAPNLPH